jgi:PAS domain S-box-containing protein
MNEHSIKNILLVEDDPIQAISQKINLEKCGYSVSLADSGHNAVATATSAAVIDLILMDIDLGKGMNGPEAAEAILRTKNIPIVFLSSHTESEIVEKTERISSYGYVIKNSSITVLNASIKMAFSLFDANKKTETSEKQFRLLFQNMNSINSLYDIVCDEGGKPVDYRYAEISPAYELLVGMKSADLIGKTLLEAFPLTDIRWLEKMEEAVTTGRTVHFESHNVELDSYSEINIYAPGNGKLVMSSTDITVRRHAEIQLRIKNEEYEALNEDLRKSLEEVQASREELESQNTELQLAERKLIENEKILQRKNNLFSSLLENIPIAVFMVDAPSGKPLLANENAFKLLGRRVLPHLTKENLASGYKAFKARTGEPYPVEEMPIVLGINGKRSHIDDMRIERPDGSSSLLEVYGAPVTDERGNVWASLASFTDITERTRFEAEKEAVRERLVLACDAGEIGIWELDLKSNALLWDSRMYTLYGLTQEADGQSYDNWRAGVHPDDLKASEEELMRAIQQKKDFNSTFRVVWPNGSIHYIRAMARVGLDADGNAVKVTGTNYDITERRHDQRNLQIKNEEYEILTEELRATMEELQVQNEELRLSEETLRESEKRFSQFMDYLPACVFLKNSEGKALFVNAYMDNALGAGRWIGKTMTEVFPNEFGRKIQDEDTLVFNTGYQKINESFSQLDGEIHDYETHKFVIPQSGKPPLLGGFALEITERNRAEQKIIELLAEKELILKEVHHRIKNNMITIYSLLTLQAGTMKDPLAILALEDAGSRVQSMMLLYDKLYKSVTYKEISIGQYLPALIDEIISNFHNAKAVRVENSIADIVLNPKQLQPLGIILNELLTNIMKYAFDEKRKEENRIAVSASLTDNSVIVKVADNGNGMPDTVDFKNSTGFGLVLVGALTKQIKGTIRIERATGTEVILEFPKDPL